MFKSLRYIIFKGLVYTLLITIVSSNYNLCSPDGILEVSNSYAKSVHLSTDHEYMVVGSVDNGTYIYKHNGFFFEEHQVFRDASGSVVSVSVSYDHNIIISGTADTSTYVYEKQQDQSSYSLNQTISNDGIIVSSIAISKSGDLLVVGGETGKTKIYKRKNNYYSQQQQLQKSSDSVRAVSVSEDGTELAIGYQSGIVEVYDYNTTFKLNQNITDNSDKVASITLIAGKIVVDNSLRIGFDQHYLVLASQAKVSVYLHLNGTFVNSQNITDCSDQVFSTILDSHKKNLAVACGDNTTYVYQKNVTTGNYSLIQSLQDAEDSAITVSFDEQGEYLAVGSADGNVRVYHSPIKYSYSSQDNEKKTIIVQKNEESKIGVGIVIGVIIGIVVTLIAGCIYVNLFYKKHSPSEVMSQGAFDDRTINKPNDKYLDEKISYENPIQNEREKKSYPQNLDFNESDVGKKDELFKQFEQDEKQSIE